MELVEFAIRSDSKLKDLSPRRSTRGSRSRILVCAVKRGKDVFIPDGHTVLEEGDRIYIASTHKTLEKFFAALGRRVNKVKNVMICGGGSVSSTWPASCSMRECTSRSLRRTTPAASS